MTVFSTIWLIVSLPYRILRKIFTADDVAYSNLDHLAFNTVAPKTEWMNMGNWSETDEFSLACHDLAELLYREAGLESDAAILDVGHGSGDSLLLLAISYQPSLLHGVTSIRSHAERARQRLKESSHLKTSQSQIVCDNVIDFLQDTDGPKYDFIFALDCAYHFRTRKTFLQLCNGRLNPGGKVALVDLVASHPPAKKSASYYTPSPSLPPPTLPQASLTSRLKHRFVTFISGVPIVNMIPVEQYHSNLREAGFDHIKIQDTSHLVFPGFAKFFSGYRKGKEAAWRGGGSLQAYALHSFASVVQEWSEGGDKGMVRSVLVVAQKAQ